MAVRITGVKKGSPAARCGIRAGDMLLKIGSKDIADVLDYMYYSAEGRIRLTLKRGDKFLILTVRKGEYDDTGLEFETFLMDKKQSCRNKCVFCFIDQMPRGMRETLYFKDDDARLSFLQGNYVTLTNLTQRDIDRIIEMKLGINVSVHTTNPELRCRMMNNRFAGEKLGYLRQMADGGISMNCQIVLCPGLNDGDELRRTLTDLGELMPHINSIAVVPVGLTKFRSGLYPLNLFDAEGAGKNIDLIEEFQQDFLNRYGTRLVYPSDEFYLTAGRPLPCGEYYEDYPQYENGVGMVRSLSDEFSEALENAPPLTEKREIAVATGAAAYGLICEFADNAQRKFPQLTCHVYKIVNVFFGETITVTGLLTARDIIAQLGGKNLGTELLLSDAMIMRNSDLFLDDLRIADVERALDIKIRTVPNDGGKLLCAMLGK